MSSQLILTRPLCFLLFEASNRNKHTYSNTCDKTLHSLKSWTSDMNNPYHNTTVAALDAKNGIFQQIQPTFDALVSKF